LRVLEGDSYGAVATVNGHGLLDRAGQFIAFGSLDFGDGVFTGLQARQLDDTVVVGAQVRAFIVVGTRHRELGALETRVSAGLNLLDGQAAEDLRVLGVDDGRQVIGCQRDLFRFNGADVVALGGLGLDDLVGAAPLKAGELGDAVLVSSHRTPSVVTGLEYELGAGQADIAALIGLDDRDGAGLLRVLGRDGEGQLLGGQFHGVRGLNGAELIPRGRRDLFHGVGQAPLQVVEHRFAVLVGLLGAPVASVAGGHLELGILQPVLAAFVSLDDPDGAGLAGVGDFDGDLQVVGLQFQGLGQIAQLIALGSLGLHDLVDPAPVKVGEHSLAVVPGGHRTPSLLTGLQGELGAGQRLTVLVDLEDGNAAQLLRVLEGDRYGAVVTVNGHGLLDRAGLFIACGSLDFGDGVFTGLQARQLDDTVVVGDQVRAFIVVGTRHHELGALETRVSAGLPLLHGQAAENLRVLGVDDGRQVIGCQRDLFRFNGADVVALGSLGLDDLVGAAPLKAGELGDAVLVSSHRTPSVVTGLEYELGAGQIGLAALVGLDDRDGAGLLGVLGRDGEGQLLGGQFQGVRGLNGAELIPRGR